MTAIFYDAINKVVACDSQATDSTTKLPAHYDAIKYGQDSLFISLTAGNSGCCETFNAFINESDYDGAEEFLNIVGNTDELQSIVVHIPTGHVAGNLSNGLTKSSCQDIWYGGSGGDFLRHNYVISEQDIKIAYDNTIKDSYTYTGGNMRTYDLTTGENNMDTVNVVNKAANDAKVQAYSYPVGEKSFDAERANSKKHDCVFDFEDLLKM